MADSNKWGGYPPSPKHIQVRRKPDSLTKRAKSKLRKFKKHVEMLKRNALCSPCGPNRPMSGLDEQAVALGIYSDTFHLLNRLDRKSKVSTALSAQRQAA